MTGWIQSLEGPEIDARISVLPAKADGFLHETIADPQAAQRVGEDEPAQMCALRVCAGCIDGNRSFDAPAPIRSPETIPRGVEAAQELRQFGGDLGFEVNTEIPGLTVISRMQLRHPAYGSRNITGDGDLVHVASGPITIHKRSRKAISIYLHMQNSTGT